MKYLSVLTASLMMTANAMAFSVEGKSSSTAFVVDESCTYLSSAFQIEAKARAIKDAEEAAQEYCGNQKAELIEIVKTSFSCSTAGVWQSLTTLKVVIFADYTCSHE